MSFNSWMCVIRCKLMSVAVSIAKKLFAGLFFEVHQENIREKKCSLGNQLYQASDLSNLIREGNSCISLKISNFIRGFCFPKPIRLNNVPSKHWRIDNSKWWRCWIIKYIELNKSKQSYWLDPLKSKYVFQS